MISVRGIRKTFATENGAAATAALDDLAFDVAPHEFVCIVGPSGCGKTTLLRILAGLIGADAGEVLVNGTRVTGPGPERAIVFQQPTLLPWANVLRNKCSVLVGSANSGKTSELRLQTSVLRGAKAHACFIAVRELLVGGAIEEALEGDEAAALRTWSKASGEKLRTASSTLAEDPGMTTSPSPSEARDLLLSQRSSKEEPEATADSGPSAKGLSLGAPRRTSVISLFGESVAYTCAFPARTSATAPGPA